MSRPIYLDFNATTRSAVRLSVGRETTGEEIDRAATALIAAWRTLVE